jgi:hypothetical protein
MQNREIQKCRIETAKGAERDAACVPAPDYFIASRELHRKYGHQVDMEGHNILATLTK